MMIERIRMRVSFIHQGLALTRAACQDPNASPSPYPSLGEPLRAANRAER